MLSDRSAYWVRRLVRLGLPPDHIAHAWNVELSDVLAPAPSVATYAHQTTSLKPRIRRLHELGYSPERIAALLGLYLPGVLRMLAPARPAPSPPERPKRLKRPSRRPTPPAPPPPRQHCPIEPERWIPRQAHCRRRQEGRLNRARSPREQAALSEWLRTAPEPVAVPELLDVERPAIDLVEVEPQICAEVPTDWGPMQAAGRPGGANGNAALSDADAARIRRRRALGISYKDLAREHGVSVATIGRIVQGRSYRNPAAVEPHDLVKPPADVAEGPGPEFERWEGPPGDRRRRGNH